MSKTHYVWRVERKSADTLFILIMFVIGTFFFAWAVTTDSPKPSLPLDQFGRAMMILVAAVYGFVMALLIWGVQSRVETKPGNKRKARKKRK